MWTKDGITKRSGKKEKSVDSDYKRWILCRGEGSRGVGQEDEDGPKEWTSREVVGSTGPVEEGKGGGGVRGRTVGSRTTESRLNPPFRLRVLGPRRTWRPSGEVWVGRRLHWVSSSVIVLFVLETENS